MDTLRRQVREGSPRAVPPATPASAWGTIGDTAHTSTSDHTPKVYLAALGSVPVVCAADFPHAPALGLDGGAYTEALRKSRDPRIGYVIFNGRIFSGHQVGSVPAHTWRPYSGSDRHDTHWHVSTVHTAAADDARDWDLGGLDMTDSTVVINTHDRVVALLTGKAYNAEPAPSWLLTRLDALQAAAAADATRDAAMAAAIQAITSNGGPESAPIIAAIQAAAAETRGYVEQLQADLADARAEAAELRERLATAFGPGSE